MPLELEALTPDATAGLTHREIRALPAYLGRRRRRLDDFFTVEGEAGDELKIVGDLGRVKWIGRGMTRGRIVIEGHAGMHLGAYMRGGVIEVSGNTADWLGAEMSGGLIRVQGDAGGQVGAAYRGGLSGMRDGAIVIGGAAGAEVGMRMKRGTIIAAGGVGDFAGLGMKGGTIVAGGAGAGAGAGMVRGTIVCLKPVPLLPTFAYASTYNPAFLGLYARRLRTLGFDLPWDEAAGAYRRYTGDTSVPGKGEILVWAPR